MTPELSWSLLNAFAVAVLALAILATWQQWALRRVKWVLSIERARLRAAWRVVDSAGCRHMLPLNDRLVPRTHPDDDGIDLAKVTR